MLLTEALSERLEEPGLPGFDPAYFISVWNSCTDAHEATQRLCTLYRAHPGEIWACADVLVQSGDILELPVLYKGAELSEATISDFCLSWTRCLTVDSVAQAQGLSVPAALELRDHLVKLGLDLRPKKDAPTRRRAKARASMSLAKINEMLDGELLIQRALLKKRKIVRDLAAINTLRQQANEMLTKGQTVHNLAEALDGPVQGMIALLQGVLQDLGVVENE